jgi:hypothetical protein
MNELTPEARQVVISLAKTVGGALLLILCLYMFSLMLNQVHQVADQQRQIMEARGVPALQVPDRMQLQGAGACELDRSQEVREIKGGLLESDQVEAAYTCGGRPVWVRFLRFGDGSTSFRYWKDRAGS